MFFKYNKEPVPLNEIARLKFHIPHVFKQYEAPFVRAIVSRNHGHCYHCGSQIFRNALKCTRRIYKKEIIECYALTNKQYIKINGYDHILLILCLTNRISTRYGCATT